MKWCPMRDAVNLLLKVFGWPGFGYTPPKMEVNGEQVEAPRVMMDKSNEVARQVELLEWELRRAGLDNRLRRHPQRGQNGV